MTKGERTRALRYKRPALASMGFAAIQEELWEIQSACDDVQYFIGQDNDTLLNALDGDDDDLWEFKVAFADLSAKADQLNDAIQEQTHLWWGEDYYQLFDDCTVALIGNRYRLIGYDADEEDYFALCGYDGQLATTEAGKRLMRHTKAEMLSIIGQCLGILISYLDLRQSYDYLKATMDILRDENTSLLKTIKEIDALYERMVDPNTTWETMRQAERDFDRLLTCLPQRSWIE